jgi:hypothetical protein
LQKTFDLGHSSIISITSSTGMSSEVGPGYAIDIQSLISQK